MHIHKAQMPELKALAPKSDHHRTGLLHWRACFKKGFYTKWLSYGSHMEIKVL